MPTWRTGADTDAYCGHCGLELAHVIVAMDGAKPARVQCKTCKSIHGFRRPAGTPDRKSSSEKARTPRSKSKSKPPETDLSDLLKGRNLAAARSYVMTQAFAANDLIRHANFGLGVVVGSPAADKVTVLFACGLKVLAHARA